MEILGIDVGGSGIKGAPVDTASGRLLADRIRLKTPSPATPNASRNIVRELVAHFRWKGPIGIGFPAIIRRQVIHTAANIDDSWIGIDGRKFFEESIPCPVTLVNDADAAGLAEMRLGAGQKREDSVLVLTLGTGIGSALFSEGRLFPNSELGHIEMRGMAAEKYTSAAVRESEALSWQEWASRLNEFLERIDRLIAPDLIIIGGGVSKKHAEFFPLLQSNAEILPAKHLNQAGILGAALAAAH